MIAKNIHRATKNLRQVTFLKGRTPMQRKYLSEFVYLFVALLLLFYRPVYAQVPHDSSATAFHFSRYALQFGLYSSKGTPLKISSFLGTLISGKYHFNDHWAVRFGLGSDVTKVKNHLDDSPNAVRSSSISTNQKYSIQSQLVYYFAPQKTIKLYAGLGPYYFYYHDKHTSHNLLVRIWGGKVVLGAEWFFLSQASLFLEYTARTRFDRYERYDSTEDNELRSLRKLQLFDSSPIQLGLTVYLTSKHINK